VTWNPHWASIFGTCRRPLGRLVARNYHRLIAVSRDRQYSWLMLGLSERVDAGCIDSLALFSLR